VSSQAKKALLSPEDTWQAKGPMDDEATLVHDLLSAEATWDNEAIPLQQNLMLAATSPRTQLQLMTPAQGSANSGATHITGGQVSLPLFICQACLRVHLGLAWLVSQQTSRTPFQWW
jgi:hypothetical protein